jgi:hypothetical protein
MEGPVSDWSEDLPDLADRLAGSSQRDSVLAQLIGLPAIPCRHSAPSRLAVMMPSAQPVISR